ncbi:CSEP0293 putative effector protein [Blumeria hordei DH14]|uniref:CSEP0293 putative effector protein n=1 Tax=Blumeria graminis f. sp. hordei (strain DH14) TaxID=546991 RepID=N1J6C5_BLUG1|nr:CSEP0293 putative effector protein [Blumeria hordei DH14]
MRFLSRSQVNSILVLATPIMLAVAESGRGYKCEKTFFKPEEINDVAKTMKALMKSNPDVPCSERKSRNLPECVRNWPKPGSGIRHSFPIKKHSRSVGYHDAGPYRVLTDLSGEVSTLLIVNQGTWKDCTPAPIYASNDEISYEIDSDNDYEGGMESCMRRFQKNCGFIKENRVKLRKNCGKIINNCGIIEDNYGQVVNNYGIIRKNHEGNEASGKVLEAASVTNVDNTETCQQATQKIYSQATIAVARVAQKFLYKIRANLEVNTKLVREEVPVVTRDILELAREIQCKTSEALESIRGSIMKSALKEILKAPEVILGPAGELLRKSRANLKADPKTNRN